jgi:glycosyltransferase involved in cell wall biosynthesis
MKIAHVMRRLSFDDWGGTEQVVWNLAKAQVKAGHEVRIFATTALCPVAHEVAEGLDIFRFRPIYPWWPMPKRLVAELDRKGGNPFVPGMGRALRDWRPDVIHCHAMARIAELCLRVGERGKGNGERGTGIKCVISLHGGGANVPTAEAKSLKAPTRRRFPWGKMIDYAMGWTRRVPEDFGGIVCVGEDEYLKYKDRHPHVMFLPNGVDVSVMAAARDARPCQRDARQPTRNVLCVARIDRQKNQMMLVEWLGRNPEASLRLVGPVTQPDYKSELEARAAALGVADRLTIVGALRPGSPELLAEYGKADVFVLPSRHEPFGIVVLEAWAAGVPVVASDVGGLGRLCAAHPGAALTFPCGDSAALDAAIGRIAADSGLKDAQIRAGKAAVAVYDWQCLATKLVGFYAQI